MNPIDVRACAASQRVDERRESRWTARRSSFERAVFSRSISTAGKTASAGARSLWRMDPHGCPICFNPHAAPRALHCGHVFCQKCIAEWHAVQISSSALESCPLCRTVSGTNPQSAAQRAGELPSLPYDRAAAIRTSAASRAARLATDYPRTSIRAQLEREHASRSDAYERRRAFEGRVQGYQASMSSPITGRPLSELEQISVLDFNRHFGRTASTRSAALSAANMTADLLLRS